MRNIFTHTPVLVTGATGFIGSHLVRKLVDLNAHVWIIKRPQASLWRLTGIENRIKILSVDLQNQRLLYSLLDKNHFQIIFHLAAETNHDNDQKLVKKVFQNNVDSSLNLLTYFLDKQIKIFVNIGTCEEYGNNIPPFHEDMWEKPISPYSASKVVISHYGDMLHRLYGFPIVTLRPFLTYGPGQTKNHLIPYCVSQAIKSLPIETTSGNQTRELHYISDTVEGILLAATAKKAIGHIIDLGDGIEYVVKDVVKHILKLTNSFSVWHRGGISRRKGEGKRFYCRGDKARNLLGWKPKVSLEKGLLKTISWYKAYNLIQ